MTIMWEWKKCEIVIIENVKVWMDENEHDSSRMLDCEARMEHRDN